MKLFESILFLVLIVTNLLAFCSFGLDKLYAMHRHRRTPESFLVTLSLFGGSFGAIVGMVLFHHKISKPKFRYLIPLLFLVQFGLLIAYLIQTAYGIQI